MVEKHFEYTTNASTQNLIQIEEFVVKSLSEFRIPKDIIDEVVISVDEAATNIMIHAYKRAGTGAIRIVMTVHEHAYIQVIMYDRGDPFNPEKISAPNLSRDFQSRSIGGLGLFLMHKFMDEVKFAFHAPKDENELIMTKFIN